MGLVVKEIDDKSIRLERKGKSTFKDFDIIVIDEASMVNDELFDMILEECARFNNKILFVGDSHQLPPVNNPNGMSKAFTIKMKSELTEIKRVQEKNPIIKTVTVIRKQIFSGNDAVFERVDDRNEEEKIGIRYMDKRDVFIDEMLDLFSSNKFQKDDNYVRALAYTNKEVSRLNNSIRERIYGDDSIEFEMGERLIAMSPLIRDDVIVINTGDRMRVTSAREIKASNCDFIAWDLGVSSPFFGSKTLRVVSDKSRDFFDGLLASMADTARKAGSRHAWSEYFMFKNQFANINYSYATTVHKAQGSTFQNVYVNERDINTLTWNNVERNKLKYVAFTRASHNLVILN
jgi:exodeoxyribonuclease-5